MEILISSSGHINHLIEEMKKYDFIVHNFPLAKKELIYSPNDYLYNKEFKNLNYQLIIDTNIFHFLLRATEGVSNQKTRAAVGLVAFCQVSEIDIDPVMAIYELINYDHDRAKEAVEKLLKFERLNNADNIELTKFCLGKTDFLSLPEIPLRNANVLISDLTKYQSLRNWDTIYLVVLYIVYTDQNSVKNRDKLPSIMKWMYQKFCLTIAGLSFSVLYFGNKPIRNMMKYKSKDSVEDRKKSLMNMTWDLYIIDTFFRKWVGNTTKNEYLYASDDRAFREIIRLAIDVQVAKDMSPFREYLSENTYHEINEMYISGIPKEDREYFMAENKGKYLTELIVEMEAILGVGIIS